MPSYSVAEAKNTLPRLIDRAIAGEEVVITRHGKVVAEVKGKTMLDSAARKRLHERIVALRESIPPMGTSTVELLNEMYDETPW